MCQDLGKRFLEVLLVLTPMNAVMPSIREIAPLIFIESGAELGEFLDSIITSISVPVDPKRKSYRIRKIAESRLRRQYPRACVASPDSDNPDPVGEFGIHKLRIRNKSEG